MKYAWGKMAGNNSTAQKMAKLKEMNGALKTAFGIESMISGYF